MAEDIHWRKFNIPPRTLLYPSILRLDPRVLLTEISKCFSTSGHLQSLCVSAQWKLGANIRLNACYARLARRCNMTSMRRWREYITAPANIYLQ